MNTNETQFVCCTKCGLIIKEEDGCKSVEEKLVCTDCYKEETDR